MSLPGSHPITLGQVCTEFGAAATTRLGLFVRGGSYVPNTPINAGVPTAEPITLGDLLGASAFQASAAPASVYGSRVTPGVAVSASCTCSHSGNTGAISRNWNRVSGDTVIAVSSTTAGTVTWSANVNGLNSLRTAVWRCTVTDSTGSVHTNNVTVTLEYTP